MLQKKHHSSNALLSGITVITGVDATKLDTYEALSKNRYDYIIFNFPHTGHKMKIHLCRALLRKFLSSAAPLLVTSGQVSACTCPGFGRGGGSRRPNQVERGQVDDL